MGVKFSNNASTTLATAINTTATSVVVASASNFPALGGSDHCYLTLQSGSTIEVVKATALSSTTFTVVRAQGGTSAASFGVGAQVELRMNVSLLTDIKDEGPDPSVLKVDQSNNRVGILNTSPDVALDAGSATDAFHVPSGTTAQRPGSPAAGYFRWNTTDSKFEGYDGSDWGEIGGGGSTLSIDNFTGDGSDTTFTMGGDPLVENNTQVYINGVYQQKNTYSISGTTLTFSTAPPNLSTIEVVRISASAISVGTPSDDSVSTTKLQNDAVTYAKIQNVSATDRILGRDSAGAGDIEEIAPSAVRTMLSLDDAGVETAYNNQVAVATQAEAEAGTSTAVKRFTPQRIGQAIAALGGLTLVTTVQTGNFTAVVGNQYLCNTTGNAISVTMPSNPSPGDTIGIVDYSGTFDSNNLTLVQASSKKIMRDNANATIDTKNWSTNLVFIDDTVGWLPIDGS